MSLALAQVQNAPVTEPRGEKQESASPAVKGAAAITEQDEKCSSRLVVGADALFVPHRWTLNHDASQTLDILGPLVAKAGKHPARIVAYTAVSDADAENRDVSQRRAISVRTWLVNHHFIAEGTPAEGLGKGDSSGHQKNGSVEVVIDTCK